MVNRLNGGLILTLAALAGCHLIFPLDARAPVTDSAPPDVGTTELGVNEAGVSAVSHHWSTSFSGTGNDVGRDLAVDSDDNVYVIGTFQGEADFGGGPVTATGTTDTFLVSFDSSGTYRWVRDLGGTGLTFGASVAVDGAGNVYVTGRFGGSTDFGSGSPLPGPTPSTAFAAFLASYDSGGTYRWARQTGGASRDEGNAVTVDPAGNVTVTGSFGGTLAIDGKSLTGAGSTDIFVASFSSDGTLRWANSFGSMWGESGNAVHADKNGNIAVVGRVGKDADLGGGPLSTRGNVDVFVASYTSQGAYRWARLVDSDDVIQVHDVVTDGAGNVFATGEFQGSAGFDETTLSSEVGGPDIFLASYTAGGTHRWAKRFGGSASDAGNSVAVDGGGNVFVTGEFFTTADFGGAKLTAASSSSGDASDIFVASFTSTGAPRWAQRFGGTRSEHGYGITVDNKGRVVVTGEFLLDVDLGGGPLTGTGNNAFVLSLQ